MLLLVSYSYRMLKKENRGKSLRELKSSSTSCDPVWFWWGCGDGGRAGNSGHVVQGLLQRFVIPAHLAIACRGLSSRALSCQSPSINKEGSTPAPVSIYKQGGGAPCWLVCGWWDFWPHCLQIQQETLLLVPGRVKEIFSSASRIFV